MLSLERYFNRLWYEQHWQRWLFWPASQLTEGLARHKRNKYLEHPPADLGVPVVVIGNLTVGGTGKTPLIIHLIERFRENGLRVGVVSRGYGGTGPHPLRVKPDTPAAAAGDEPAMIVRRTGVPLVVDPDRARGAMALLKSEKFDVILSDDGLQHYRLPRQVEIVVIDGERGFGNGHLLPMGPLREPLERLASLRFAVINGEASPPLREQLASYPHLTTYAMSIKPGQWRPLAASDTGKKTPDAGDPVVALAAIGNPARFFNTLNTLGIRHRSVTFPDHHRFSEQELLVIQSSTVVMTEKDAVKIPPEWLPNAWYLPIDADITSTLADDIMRALSLK